MNFPEFRRLLALAPDLDCEGFFMIARDEVPHATFAEIFGTWYYAHDRTPKCVRELLGQSRAAFHRFTGVPLRTLENWDAGTREAPPYAVDLLAFAVISAILDVPQDLIPSHEDGDAE